MFLGTSIVVENALKNLSICRKGVVFILTLLNIELFNFPIIRKEITVSTCQDTIKNCIS